MTSSRTGRAVAGSVITLLVVVAIVVTMLGLYRWASSFWTAPPTYPSAHCEAVVNGQTATLTPEQAVNAAVIAGVASQRRLIPRAVSIGLATAFQESGLRNLDYGDRDSLGLFQQRPSMGWGTPEQIMDPYYSAGKFYDVMVTVADWQTADIGYVAQEVQRSGFPDAYDQHVNRARLIASALSGETPAAWSCMVDDPAPPDPDQLLMALTRAYGSTILATPTPATESAPATITLTAMDEATAWSAAAFAQSWAIATGVTQVSVGQFGWQAAADVLSGWVGVPESDQAATTAVVTF